MNYIIIDCCSIPACIAYKSDEDKIEIEVDYSQTAYLDIITELEQKTGRIEMNFRIKEYLPSEYKPYKMSPGDKCMTSTSVGASRYAASNKVIGAIGTFFQTPNNPDIYAITAGHVIEMDQECFDEDSEEPFGACIEVVCQNQSPIFYDLAIIKLFPNHPVVENFILSSQAIPCRFQFPKDHMEVQRQELWKCQRKAHGTWQYCYLRYYLYYITFIHLLAQLFS